MIETSRQRASRPVQVGIQGLRIGPADTVVDVGCGVGSICRYAGEAGAAVIGIDTEPSLIARADEAMREVPARSWRGIVSDCEPIPLPDGTASIVFCTEVLEHIDDPVRFVAETSDEIACGPAAAAHISVPDPASEGLIRQVAPSWYWEPPFHRRVFHHHDLATACSASSASRSRHRAALRFVPDGKSASSSPVDARARPLRRRRG